MDHSPGNNVAAAEPAGQASAAVRLAELVQLGLAMRDAQARYFRTRQQSALEDSEAAERLFDVALRRELGHANQQDLFSKQSKEDL